MKQSCLGVVAVRDRSNLRYAAGAIGLRQGDDTIGSASGKEALTLPYDNDILNHTFTKHFIRIKAWQLCTRSDFSSSDFNDLRQSMRTYLWQNVHLYDPSRGSIEAFVTSVIKSCIAMLLRHRDRLKRRGDIDAISLEGTFVEHDGHADMLRSAIGDDERFRRVDQSGPTPIELLELQDALRHVFTLLSDDEREVLLLVAEHGVLGAARELTRRSERSVSRRQIENAIARMRSRFEDAGLGAD